MCVCVCVLSCLSLSRSLEVSRSLSLAFLLSFLLSLSAFSLFFSIFVAHARREKRKREQRGSIALTRTHARTHARTLYLSFTRTYIYIYSLKRSSWEIHVWFWEKKERFQTRREKKKVINESTSNIRVCKRQDILLLLLLSFLRLR